MTLTVARIAIGAPARNGFAWTYRLSRFSISLARGCGARKRLGERGAEGLRRGGTWIQRWRVPLGFLCLIPFLWFARPTLLTLLIGGFVAILGLGVRAWAAGHIRKNDVLATTGPYAYTRNPLYLGSFLLGAGFTIASGQPLLAIPFLALFVGIYFPVMRVESRQLAELFGEEYSDYARAVPLFFPRLTPYRSERVMDAKFDTSLYLRYREYRAALGLLVAWGVLALKAVFVK
ncbi:MAG: isoprenylcysteine carboxylmethyltransferase family protein [Acidobacteria bacterium]|nr:MAG: isoprenylcysteine carboxylmethyltransferase family protein [Acidobacteriota bacterium]